MCWTTLIIFHFIAAALGNQIFLEFILKICTNPFALSVVNLIKETINSVKSKAIEQVGLKLIKFCAKWDMQKIAEYPQTYADPLNAKYKIKEEAIA